MREKYWAMYQQIKFSEYYYWHYRGRSAAWCNAADIFLALATLACLASWSLWADLAPIWSIVLISSQMASIVRPCLPCARRVGAVNSLMPGLRHLCNEIDYDWETIDGMLRDKIAALVFGYGKRFIELEMEYAGPVHFPRREACVEKAEKDTDEYLIARHGCQPRADAAQRLFFAAVDGRARDIDDAHKGKGQ